MITNP